MGSDQFYFDDPYGQESNVSAYSVFTDVNNTSPNEVYDILSYDYYTETSTYSVYKMVERIFMPVMLGLTSTVGIVGNLLVMITMRLSDKVKTPGDVLVFNLCVASMCLLVFVVPTFVTAIVLDSWPFGDALCKLVPYLKDVSDYATVYTLMAIAACQFHDSVYPFLSPCVHAIGSKTLLYTTLCAILAWVVFMACLSPIITYMQSTSVGFEERTLCIVDMTFEEIRKLVICHFALLYVVPLSISLCLYVCVMVKHIRLHVHDQSYVPINGDTQPTHRRDTVTYLIMTLVVVVLWGSKWIGAFAREVNGHFEYTSLNILVIIISENLSYIPPSVFPIILFARSEELRQGLRKTLYRANPDIQNRNFNGADSIGLRTGLVSKAS